MPLPSLAVREPRAVVPIALSERIASIDVLRGVAVLGILLMNIQSFSMIGAAYHNPTSFGDLREANYWVWLLSHVFSDLKFITIFSMLFGAGVVLMTGRIEASGKPSAKLHYRRMGWLIMFGALHAYLLWPGDILVHYGICGTVVYVCRKFPLRRLIVMGLACILVASMVGALYGLFLPPDELRSFQNDQQPSPSAVAEDLAIHRGSWKEQLSGRASNAFEFETTAFFWGYFWREIGLMFIGIALFRIGVFSAELSRRWYWSMIAAALVIGIPAILYGVHRDFAAGWRVQYTFFFGVQYNYWASLLVSFGWVGLVMLVCQTRVLAGLVRPIAATGRMAFSNYILQTLICTTIFYGYGFGLYGRVSRAGQLGIVLLIWACELALSTRWLRHFRFGPLEWLWRTLTYWKWQPFRLHSSEYRDPMATPSA